MSAPPALKVLRRQVTHRGRDGPKVQHRHAGSALDDLGLPRVIRLGAGCVALAAVMMALGATGVAQAAYKYRGIDAVNTTTSHSRVGGFVVWYQDCPFPFPCTFRGQFAGTYVLSRGAYRGCIYTKAVWHRLAPGAIAWPPSASPNTTSDGYYRSCRRRGQDRPRAIRLTGVNMASRVLYAVTVTTCHARSSSAPKVCSSIKRYG